MDVGRIWGFFCLAWRVHHLSQGGFSNIPLFSVPLRNKMSLLSRSKSRVALQIHLIKAIESQTHGIMNLGFIMQ